MDDIVFAGNRALYLILVMSAGPLQLRHLLVYW